MYSPRDFSDLEGREWTKETMARAPHITEGFNGRSFASGICQSHVAAACAVPGSMAEQGVFGWSGGEVELMGLGKGTPMLPVLISWARVVVRCDIVLPFLYFLVESASKG